MASSRKRYKPDHKKLAKNLRAAGLLPKGYVLNRLTKNQKDRIVKIAHKNKSQAARGSDFVPKKVSWKDARTLKAAGYHVKLSGKKPTVAFEKYGAQRVRFAKGEVIRSRPGYVTRTQVGGDIFENARKFFATADEDQYLMLSVGGTDWKINISSYNDFVKYMAHWRERYGQERWEKIRDHLTIVEVTNPSGQADDVAA